MLTDAQFAQLAARTYTDPPTWTGDARSESFQAVLFQADGITVVAPRGSRSALEWAADFLAIPFRDDDTIEHATLGHVHLGILLGALSIYPQVKAAILAAGAKRALTGHSLGGGLALALGALLTADGITVDRIVTFAAPRFGHERYVALLAPVSIDEYRYGNDPVPQVPLSMEHAREPIRIGTIRPGIAGALSCHHMPNYLDAVSALEAPRAA